jgi:hypothetical protein
LLSKRASPTAPSAASRLSERSRIIVVPLSLGMRQSAGQGYRAASLDIVGGC